MQSKKGLSEEIQVISTLNDLIKTYEEIYMLKMYRTRNSVLNTRDYYVRILKLYKSIKQSYKSEILSSVDKKNRNGVFSLLTKTKQQVLVFISGNDRFAGDINNRIFIDFIDQFSISKSDLVVIGQIGKNLMKQRASRLKYKYFDLAEDFGVSSSKQLQPIVDYLIDYADVRVFYGEFENMVKQDPVSESITGELDTVIANKLNITDGTSTKVESKAFDKVEYFLAEPSLNDILVFFETQIFNSLFKRGVEEATLAQIGARVGSLEKSTYQIDKKLKLLNYINLKENKYVKNKKQQGLLAGINFWEKQNAR